MKPAPFDYVAPTSLAEALEVLSEQGQVAKALAGGQSLVPLLNFRLAQPALLVDLNRIAELDWVRPTADGGLSLGAMTRQRRLEKDPEVARRAPLLAEAAPWIAHPQIRNRGTVGGSLAHADPAGELPALAVALAARFRLCSRAGERWVAAEEFFLGLLTTDLAPGELLVEVEVPPAPPRTGWAFAEIARRRGDYAQVGLAAGLTLDGAGICRRARLVYFSVGDGPVTAPRAAALLEGEGPSPAVFEAAAEVAAGEEMDPDGDIHASADYKRHLARVLTRRALAQAAERASREGGDR